MAKTKHTIELNGQVYDALTGVRLEKGEHTLRTGQPVSITTHRTTKATTPVHGTTSAAAKPAAASNAATNMDGVNRHKKTAGTPRPAKPAAQAHSRAQHSQTLMRTTVKKPAAIKPLKRAAPTLKPAATKSDLVSNPSHDSFVQPERIIRSMGVAKSAHITRFGKQTASVKATPLAVTPAPPAGKHHRTPDLAPPQTPQHAIASERAGTSSTPADLFAAALSQATSHDQPKYKPTSRFGRTAARLRMKPRTLAIGGSALVLLLVAGVFIQQNAPYMAMRIAASRAGVSATLPKYQPAGFTMERPIDYDPGQVSVTYKSNSDSRDFKVIQRASSWTSDVLRETVIGNRDHQVYQASGRTVYIYDNNTATWVDGGVWYQIVGNSNLSSDQLHKIIDSL